jgi:hypothetical protein
MIVAACAVAALSVSAAASDPLAVYCMIDKVVLEPPDCPDRAQIWGACMPSNAPRPAAPKRGFFFYKPKPGQEDITRREWADLKSVAGKEIAVGFGRRGYPYGTFHALDARFEAPDEYPIHLGVTQLGDNSWPAMVYPNFFQALQAAVRAR